MRPLSRRAVLSAVTLVALAACQPSPSPRGPIAAAFPAPAAPCPSALAPVDDTPQPPDVEPPPAADAAIYATSTEQEAIARKLAGSILVGGHAFDYLRDLTDTYGARLTGSPAYALAAAWAAESFKRAGVDSVRFEEVTIPHGWERRDASARLVAPLDRALHVLPSPWSEPTPPEGVRGEVYVLTDFSTEAIRARSSALRGKIVLASRDVYSTKGKYSWPRIVAAPAELKKAGALAILMYSGLEGQAMRVSSGGTLARIDSPIPRALIGQEDALLLRRLSEKGPVTITYANTSPVTGPVKVPEVLAEIRGREKPDEWVLVGAHLDSWDLATGAQDNGSGSAEVLEAARAIRALGVPSRRSIRFALFCGEEQGLYGSESYVRAHANELDKGVLVLVSDGGAGAPIGWDLNGREDAKRRLQPLATSLLAGLGGDKLDAEGMFCGSDDCSFMLRGVPTAGLMTERAKYESLYHLPSDTLDKVNRAALDAGAAIMAVTAYAVADAPVRLARRNDRATVRANLVKGDLLEQVQAQGSWK
jgi:hypothetical protein